ncbi:MAG TPA: ABC transporter substrate-binding protein [Ilumatobacter sp.]|nr:ABC transporter substrate-binding protein [Ilumatobacter sp.]
MKARSWTVAAVAMLFAACGGSGDSGTAVSQAPIPARTSPDTSGGTPPSTTAAPSDGSAAESPAPAGTNGPPAAGEYDLDATLRYARQVNPTQFDPHLSTNFRTDEVWQELVYDSLLTMAVDGSGTLQLAPNLASSFEVSEDGLQVTLELRDDVFFTDGQPFDSAAVQANIERGQTAEGSGVATVFEQIESVATPDDRTAVLTLSEPDDELLYWLATVPGYMVSPAAFDGDLALHPVGTSAYVLAAATDFEVTYERRSDGQIWDDRTGLVKTIVITGIPDDNARVSAFQAGEFDVATVQAATLPLAKPLVDNGVGTIRYTTPSSISLIYLNIDRPPLDDPRVRSALSLAIDRQLIDQSLFDGDCPATSQMLPTGIPGHIADLEPVYDPERAAALIDEAGATGSSFDWTVANVPALMDTAQAVQQMWADVGINANLIPFDGSTVRAEFRTGRGDASMIYLAATPPEPGVVLGQFAGVDSPGGVPPELTPLVDAALGLRATDPARIDAFEDVTRYLYEHPLHIAVCESQSGSLLAPYVVPVLPSYNAFGVDGYAVVEH